MPKYSRDQILDLTKVFPIQSGANLLKLRRALYEGTNFASPKDLPCYTLDKCSAHGRVDAAALASFGAQILMDNHEKNCVAYHLSLPSVNCLRANHAVALMVDHGGKEIWYQDSYGVEMRKEMRDFLKLLLPKYRQAHANRVQQFRDQDDSSCFLMTEFNLRDMWYRKTGQTDKICDYDSPEARTTVLPIVEQMDVEITTSKTSGKKELLEQSRDSQRDFAFRLSKQKDYKQQLQIALAGAQAGHQCFCAKLSSQLQTTRQSY